MKQIIFYSWQSDLPNATNRGFIQEALESAATLIASDASVAIEPVVDRDTQGVPGSPDIASTIFSKITASDAFVADVSITGIDERRTSPNPNVLIELGYALKAVGHERVILVFNRAFGRIEDLPFDLRARRIIAYDMPKDAKERAPERKMLTKQVEIAIRAALQHSAPQRTSAIPAESAIESQAPNRIIVLRRNLAAIFERLDRCKPKIFSAGGTVDDLIEGIKQTQEPVAEFSKIAEMIAAMSDVEAALELSHWFGKVFERYKHPEGFSGTYSMADFDYFKFLGYESFVTFIAFLLQEQRWSILESILTEPIPVRYLSRPNGPGTVNWEYASQHLPSLLDESSRRRRMSIHADLLNERHTEGGLAAIMPFADFMAADYFLFLASVIPQSDEVGFHMEWRPWSVLYLKTAPLFLRSAEHKKFANELAKILDLPNVDEFKTRMLKRAASLGALFNNGIWFNPVQNEDIERIGTR